MAITSTDLQKLYVAYYGRPADPTGLAYWLQVTAAASAAGEADDTILLSVSNSFGGNAEYTSNFTGLNSDAIINRVYLNLFSHAPDPSGLAYWSLKLSSGDLTLAQIVRAVSDSAVTAGNLDGIAYTSKVTAAESFTNALDSTTEILGYTGAAAGALAKAWITGINSAATLAAAIATAALNTTVTAVTDAGNVVTGQTYSLTTGVDSFTGGAGNDTFNAANNTETGSPQLSGLDALDGGNGTDTLNVVDPNGGQIRTTLPTSVKNIETVNLTSVSDLGDGRTANVSAWTGVTALNVTTAANGAETITAATTTVVTVTNSSSASVDVIGGGGVLTITNGAGTITANNAAANAFTSAVISGGSTVAIADHSGASAAVGSTLTSVSLSGNTVSATLTGNGITAVTLTKQGSGAYTTVVAAAATRTLGLTVNTLTDAVITDATATTVNVTSTGAASVVADLAAAAAKTVSLAGDKALTLTTTHFDAATALTVSGSALTTISGFATTGVLTGVTVTGAGGLTANLSTQTVLTSITATGSSGANTISMDGTKASYAGGSGVDKVTIGAVATKVIDGGTGTADEIIVNTATFAANATKLVNFEVLGMGTAATGGTFDATGFAKLHVGSTISGDSAFNNIAAGTDLTIDGSLNKALTYTLKDATSVTSDAATIHVGNATTAGLDITTALGSVVTTGVELLTIDSLGTGTGTNTLAVTNTGALTLTVTGGEAITLTGFGSSTLTTINASAATKLVDVSALTVAAAGTTVTGGAGGLKFIGGAGVDTVTGGAGADTIATVGGKDVIVGGGGADLITAGAAADKITVSGTTGKIIQAAGDSGANTSTTIQTAELTSTFDVIYGASAGFKIDLGNANIVTGTLTTAGTNLAAGVVDTAVFARGTYDSAAGTFTFAANGLDTAVTYDSNVAGGVTAETIILVGFVSGATTAVAGILTLV